MLSTCFKPVVPEITTSGAVWYRHIVPALLQLFSELFNPFRMDFVPAQIQNVKLPFQPKQLFALPTKIFTEIHVFVTK